MSMKERLEDRWCLEIGSLREKLLQLRQRYDQQNKDALVQPQGISRGVSVERSSGSGGTDRSVGSSRSHLKKVDPPTLSGKSTDYVDFKIQWKEPVATQFPEDSPQIYTIKNQIPKADKERKLVSSLWPRFGPDFTEFTVISTLIR